MMRKRIVQNVIVLGLLLLATTTLHVLAAGESNDEQVLTKAWEATKKKDQSTAEKLWLTIFRDPAHGQYHNTAYAQLIELYASQNQDSKAMEIMAVEFKPLTTTYAPDDVNLAKVYEQSANSVEKQHPAQAKYLRQLRDGVVAASKKRDLAEWAFMQERVKALKLMQNGKAAEAVTLLKDEIRRLKVAVKRPNPELPYALVDLSRAQQQLKQTREAGLTLAEAIEILSRDGGHYHKSTISFSPHSQSYSSSEYSGFRVNNLYPICKKLLADSGQLDKLPQVSLPAPSRHSTPQIEAKYQTEFEKTYYDLAAFTKAELTAIDIWHTDRSLAMTASVTYSPESTFRSREDPRITKALSLFQNKENLPEAEKLLLEVVATGKNSSDKEMAKHLLNAVYIREGKIDAAVEAQKKELPALIAEFGATSPRVASQWEDIARAYDRPREHPDVQAAANARRERDRIMAANEARRKSQWICMQQRRTALQLAQKGDLSQALSLLAKELPAAQALTKPNGEAPAVMIDMARIYQKQGNKVQAVDWYNKAIESLLKMPRAYEETEASFTPTSKYTHSAECSYGKGLIPICATCRQLLKELKRSDKLPGVDDQKPAPQSNSGGARLGMQVVDAKGNPVKGVRIRLGSEIQMEEEMNDFAKFLTSELAGIEDWRAHYIK